MEKKKGFAKSLERFFAGKGFYIVLFLCVAVIGVSAWAMLARTVTDVEDDAANVSAYDGYIAPVGPIIPAPENSPRIPNDTAQGGSGGSGSGAEEAARDIAPEEPDVQTQAITAPEEQDTPTMAETEHSPGYIWPLVGEIETPYSVAALIYNKTMSDWRTHDGIDLTAEIGTQVMAISSGRVEKIYGDDLFGVTLVIDHGGGVRSVYSNLADTPTVYEGSSVTTGEVIGAVGTTALAEAGEAPHLHFSMTLDGLSIDPALYLPPR